MCISGVPLDSDSIILEMDQNAGYFSANRTGTITIDSNAFRIISVIIKLLQGKLSNIASI